MPNIDWMLATQIVLALVSLGAAAIALWNARSANEAADAAKKQAVAATVQAEAARTQADAAVQQAKSAAESVDIARQANSYIARQVELQESANVPRLRASIRFADGPLGANSPVPIVTIVNDGTLAVTIQHVVFLTRTGERIEGDRTWKGRGGPFLPRKIEAQHRIEAFWDRDQLRANIHYLREPVSIALTLSNGDDWPALDETETRQVVDQFLKAIQRESSGE